MRICHLIAHIAGTWAIVNQYVKHPELKAVSKHPPDDHKEKEQRVTQVSRPKAKECGCYKNRIFQ